MESNKTEDKLVNKYKELNKIIKNRSDKGSNNKISKVEFMNHVFDNIDSKVFDDVLIKNTPKEFFIKEAMINNPELKDKLYNLIENK